jgi:hypothetical protein
MTESGEPGRHHLHKLLLGKGISTLPLKSTISPSGLITN